MIWDEYLREIGSDVAEGETMLESGTQITAAEFGILIASERRLFKIYRRPKIVVMSTGDEVL